MADKSLELEAGPPGYAAANHGSICWHLIISVLSHALLLNILCTCGFLRTLDCAFFNYQTKKCEILVWRTKF